MLPLTHGPSGIVRFLVTIYDNGCVGYTGGVTYGLYQWLPEGNDLKRLILSRGGMNLDDNPGEIGPPNYPTDERVNDIYKKEGVGETPDG